MAWMSEKVRIKEIGRVHSMDKDIIDYFSI